MYTKPWCLWLLLACMMSTASAQEGHPLVGTWQGNLPVSDGDDIFLTIIMFWDGQSVSGIVNPGPLSTELGSAVLDSSDWTVHIETSIAMDGGTALNLLIDGQLENTGSQTRSITGEWRHENGSGTIKLTRQGGA